MNEGFLCIVQLTDTHVIKGRKLYDLVDTSENLETSVAAINAMEIDPDLVLITGDLVDRANTESYEHLLQILAPLRAPWAVIPGNHDDPELMAEVLGAGQSFPVDREPWQYVIEDLPVRILCLNSRDPEYHWGLFDEQRCAWLEARLNESDAPTLIAIHHPPVNTMLAYNEPEADWARQFRNVVAKHDHVRLIIAGHTHKPLTSLIGGATLYVAPSSAFQLSVLPGVDRPPLFVGETAPLSLHMWDGSKFLTSTVELAAEDQNLGLDRLAGVPWDKLKARLTGARRNG